MYLNFWNVLEGFRTPIHPVHARAIARALESGCPSESELGQAKHATRPITSLNEGPVLLVGTKFLMGATKGLFAFS